MTNPGSSPYTDPELLISGELTPGSDVYSFGVVVLRLVTGHQALGIASRWRRRWRRARWRRSSTGRPAMAVPAGREAHAARACSAPSSAAGGARADEPGVEGGRSPWQRRLPCQPHQSLLCVLRESHMPSCFHRPISQEVMRNPHTAADGYTYEAEAIKGWLDSGHETSPMTKLPLVHRHVTPSYALRSVIQDYATTSTTVATGIRPVNLMHSSHQELIVMCPCLEVSTAFGVTELKVSLGPSCHLRCEKEDVDVENAKNNKDDSFYDNVNQEDINDCIDDDGEVEIDIAETEKLEKMLDTHYDVLPNPRAAPSEPSSSSELTARPSQSTSSSSSPMTGCGSAAPRACAAWMAAAISAYAVAAAAAVA
ncbi:U-box domain-containing protein 33 [Hordeum vulgare]|nr:U-box domain-containing protein 33 [Hordeum vulgare]